MIIRAENKRSGNVPKRTARGIANVALVTSCAVLWVSAASARYKRAAIAGPKSSRTRAAELLVSTTPRSRFRWLQRNGIGAPIRGFAIFPICL